MNMIEVRELIEELATQDDEFERLKKELRSYGWGHPNTKKFLSSFENCEDAEEFILKYTGNIRTLNRLRERKRKERELDRYYKTHPWTRYENEYCDDEDSIE